MEAGKVSSTYIDAWKKKSILTASDSDDMRRWGRLLRAGRNIEEVSAHIIDDRLVRRHGLPYVVERSRAETMKPLIYRTRIGKPQDSDVFVDVCSEPKVDAVILQSSIWERTARVPYIDKLKNRGIEVIIDSITYSHVPYDMSFSEKNKKLLKAYDEASDLGARFFVVSGKGHILGVPIMEETLVQIWHREPIFFVEEIGENLRYLSRFARRNTLDNWHLVVHDGALDGRSIERDINDRVAALGGFVQPMRT